MVLGPDLPRPMAGHCFELIPQGIFIFDGRRDYYENTLTDTFIYDNDTRKWTEVGLVK